MADNSIFSTDLNTIASRSIKAFLCIILANIIMAILVYISIYVIGMLWPDVPLSSLLTPASGMAIIVITITYCISMYAFSLSVGMGVYEEWRGLSFKN